MLHRLVLKIALLSLLRSPSLRHCGLKCLIKLDRTLIKIKRNLIKNHLREVGSPPGRYFMRGVGGQIAGKVSRVCPGPWASWGRPEESRLIPQSRFLVAPKIPLGGIPYASCLYSLFQVMIFKKCNAARRGAASAPRSQSLSCGSAATPQ